ncbi:MAG TPA: carboxymuconolactone decarboxylase family protein [Noviherbaspirillum sp.]|jgi:alkylhydroperoxidase family enzyme|uniref:carboxymuconolactone decarboxylase family protein n=1 Tax=Noviherbaspirillum sp. TaxID=1926288 RepID=UPI002DDC9DA7|nr:carboxymuconolactone decarboxylase family protein [Noviherbaspirillum sp.]HEV2610666.1 carboxymuconolactone decarboxylase family protein [Noviherbaspirillum sp.]
MSAQPATAKSDFRISPIEPPYSNALSDTFVRVMPPGVAPLKLFRTMARNPRVLQRMFAGSFLDQGGITLRERELVILRTCFRCNCEYEWGVHVAFFSQKAALSKADVTATLENESHSLPDNEALILELVDQLHGQAQVTDELWTALARHYSDEQLLELIALTGYYHTISFIANAAGVQAEEYAPRFG